MRRRFRRSSAAAALVGLAAMGTAACGAGRTAPAPAMPAEQSPAEATAAATLPKTVVAAAVADWLELFNQGDEAAVRDFLFARFTPDFVSRLPVPALVAFHLQSLERYGALTPATVLEDEPHRMVLLADSESGDVMELTVEVTPDEPHRISTLRLVPTESP